MFLWGLFVGDVQKANTGQGADEENDVKPAMIEVELKITQHLGYDHSETQQRGKYFMTENLTRSLGRQHNTG